MTKFAMQRMLAGISVSTRTQPGPFHGGPAVIWTMSNLFVHSACKASITQQRCQLLLLSSLLVAGYFLTQSSWHGLSMSHVGMA